MSVEEYQHKFAVQSIPGLEELPKDISEEACSAIENAVKKSRFSGRYLINFSELPDHTGFVLEMDKPPTRRELNRLSALKLKETYY
ncbi:MAG TPA: hypothetical protein VJ485_00480 [archaeon]|nr:hypothetical protein [archaeon]